MRALVTTAHGDRSVLQLRADYPDPVAGEREVVIRVAATGVNFHDVFTRRGMPGLRIALPVVVGSDIAGIVESVGPGADPALQGRRVLVDPVFRGGRFGMIGETIDGGRAELVRVPDDMLVPIPAGVTLEAAAALPLAYGTAYRMLVTRGRVAAGERVLVLGASGGVGTACVQIAKMLGAEVIACASSAAKLARLAAIGADHGVDYARAPFREGVHALVGKPRMNGTGGVDVAINFTGGDTLVDTQRCVRLGGRILCCGATAGFRAEIDARYWWTFEHAMLGSDGWQRDDLAALLALVTSGRLAPLVDRVLDIGEAAEAERLLEEREVVGKVLLRP